MKTIKQISGPHEFDYAMDITDLWREIFATSYTTATAIFTVEMVQCGYPDDRYYMHEARLVFVRVELPGTSNINMGRDSCILTFGADTIADLERQAGENLDSDE